MLKAVLLFLLGFALLIKGGDWFVDGSVGIAHRFHLPELLIGATIVSIGTTLPEHEYELTELDYTLSEHSFTVGWRAREMLTITGAVRVTQCACSDTE